MKIASSERRAVVRRASRSEAVIAFSISGQLFAISAHAVQEIRTTDSVGAGSVEISVPGVPKVRHYLTGARGTIYIVAGWQHFGLTTSRPAQVILLRGNRVGVLVDSIDRMEMMRILMNLPAGFCGPERTWYRGVTMLGEGVVPVVSSSGFLSVQEIAELDAESNGSSVCISDVLAKSTGRKSLENEI